jgi:hypothetical protein
MSRTDWSVAPRLSCPVVLTRGYGTFCLRQPRDSTRCQELLQGCSGPQVNLNWGLPPPTIRVPMPMATSTTPITIQGTYVTCSFLSLVQVSRNPPACWDPNRRWPAAPSSPPCRWPPVALLPGVNRTAVSPAASNAVADFIADRDNRKRTTCAMSIPPLLRTLCEFTTMKITNPGPYPVKRSVHPLHIGYQCTIVGPNKPPRSSTPLDRPTCGGQGYLSRAVVQHLPEWAGLWVWQW